MLCKLVILIYTNSNTHLGKISGFDFIAQMRGMILVSSYCNQFVWLTDHKEERVTLYLKVS